MLSSAMSVTAHLHSTTLSLAELALMQLPNNYRVQMQLAYWYSNRGYTTEAYRLLAELTARNPTHTLYWHAWVDISVANQNRSASLWALAKLRALNPQYPELDKLTARVSKVQEE